MPRALEVELSAAGPRASAWTGARWRRGRTRAGWKSSSTRPTGCRWSAGPCASGGSTSTAAAAALWPAYRQALRDYERVRASSATPLLETGGARPGGLGRAVRRAGRGAAPPARAYVRAAAATASARGVPPGGRDLRRSRVDARPPAEGEAGEQRRLADELAARAARRAPRAAQPGGSASRRRRAHRRRRGGGASRPRRARPQPAARPEPWPRLEVYRAERGTPAVALLDDLDSELDEERAAALCRRWRARGQALVTTAHPRLGGAAGGTGRVFAVGRKVTRLTSDSARGARRR